MNEPTMHDFDLQLDQAIDALNRESSPYEGSDHELFSLVDTARLMKSLRDPAEPDADFAALAGDRIAGELSRAPATSNNGIPPASAPTVRPLDSGDAGTPRTPGPFRSRLSEISELAAVLLVIVVVVGGVALSQTVFSGGDGDAEVAGPGPTDVARGPVQIISEMRLDDAAFCCGVYGEIDEESHLFALSLYGGEQSGHGMLHVMHVDDDGTLQEVGVLETPVQLMGASLTGVSHIALVDDVLYLPLPEQDGPGGLWVVDVSDPESPEEIALVETEFPPLSVSASGDVAAVATFSFNGPFLFFDISDPNDVRLVGEIEHSVDFLPQTIALDGSLFYILNDDGIDLIDVANPDSPRLAGTVENPDSSARSSSDDPPGLVRGMDGIFPPDTFLDMAASEQYLYIAASDGGLRIIDVSDPSTPLEAGQLELPGRAVRIAVSGDQVYVLSVEETEEDMAFLYTIHVIDVSDPGIPRLAESFEGPDMLPPNQALVPGDDFTFLLNNRTVHVIGEGTEQPSDDGSSADPVPTETLPDEPDSTPLPDDPDMQRGLSFDEAQEISPFELIRPDPVPESLELIGIDVRLASDTHPVDEAHFMYRLVDGEMPDEPIIFKQSNAVGVVSHPDAVEKTIGSRTVTTFHTAINDEGIPLAVYAWTEGGVTGRSYMVSVRLAGDVTEKHLEAFIAALPADAGTTPDGSTPTDPIEFVLAYMQAMEERDMDAVRIMDWDLDQN